MKNKVFSAILSVILGVVLTASQAAEKTLIVASWLPPSHAVNAYFLPKLNEEIEKRTDGRVNIKVEYNLAPPNGLLELVEYGGADISWTYNGYFPGRFSTTKLIELPGYIGNSEMASVAHWKAHEKYLNKAGEFDGVELIGLMVHAPADLFMGKGKTINSLTELEGRKMRTGGGVANAVAEALKVSPILAPATKSYEMISGDMADGTFLPMDVVPLFRLYEAAPNAYSLPGGFYRGSFSLFMNEEALEDVSDADQQAIRAYFGEELSKDAGKAWDEDYQKGLDVAKEKGTVTDLSAEDIAAFAKLTEQIKADVIAEINKKDIDGVAAYELIVESMSNYPSK